MINHLQKFLSLDEELRASCRLIKLGLGELQCISMAGELRNYESQMLGEYNGLHVLATGAAQNLET